MDFFIPLALSGIAMGAIYGLVALGFVLLINAVNIINIAQGEFLMLGSFFVFTFAAIWGLPLIPAILLMIVAAAIVGIVFERAAYRPLRGGDIATFIVSTLAASLVIRNVALNVWGPYPFAFREPFGGTVLTLAGLRVNPQHLLIIGVTAVLMVALYLFFFHTRLGKMMRAMSQDKATASLLGIPVTRIGSITFVIAASIGAVAGVLVAPIFFVNIEVGFRIGLKAFIATIIGGWGSVPGAITGGVVLGVVEVLAAAYLSSQYKDAFAFLFLILFLLARPQGIFGEIGGVEKA
jgi:branched-chain amino acid transport system permease protein